MDEWMVRIHTSDGVLGMDTNVTNVVVPDQRTAMSVATMAMAMRRYKHHEIGLSPYAVRPESVPFLQDRYCKLGPDVTMVMSERGLETLINLVHSGRYQLWCDSNRPKLTFWVTALPLGYPFSTYSVRYGPQLRL
jgi:hypothetical protein